MTHHSKKNLVIEYIKEYSYDFFLNTASFLLVSILSYILLKYFIVIKTPGLEILLAFISAALIKYLYSTTVKLNHIDKIFNS